MPPVRSDGWWIDLAERAVGRHDWIEDAGRPDRRTADDRASPTDPDASPLRPTGSGLRLGDHDHSVVDGGKARIILAALVTPAEVQDWHGLRRFRLRGLLKVNGAVLLIAAGQNLKRLLSRAGWGRRPWPHGAARLALSASVPVSAAIR